MATAIDQDLLSDQSWLLYRGRECMKTDPYAAKAWLITAKTLFPKNFLIQFEAYTLEKDGGSVKEAARLLEEMFVSFPQEGSLLAEVQATLGAMQSDTKDAKAQFNTELFATIPAPVQCQMLLCVALKIDNILEQCKLMLLAMKKFPSLIPGHGVKLVDMLLAAEKQAACTSSLNCYRKLLVWDVLPLVLSDHRPQEVSDKQLIKWLQKAIQFYMAYITLTPSQEGSEPGEITSPIGDLRSPTKTAKKALIIPGLPERECHITDPWGNSHNLLLKIGKHLGWELEAELFTKPGDYQWQQIISVYNRERQNPGHKFHKQILYTTACLFLECLHGYIIAVDAEQFGMSSSGSSQGVPIVLVEGVYQDERTAKEPRAKKLRPDGPIQPSILPSPGVRDSQQVIQNFLTAVKCYELLQANDHLRHSFRKLTQIWQMETWHWMMYFQTDVFIYQGIYQDAISLLQNFGLSPGGNTKLRTTLQLASCYYGQGNYAKSCELILENLTSLPNAGTGTSKRDADGTSDSYVSMAGQGQERHLLLMSCTETELLPYCIQMIFNCLKEKALSSASTDLILGHVLVLLQYDWPKHEGVFSHIIKKIHSQGSLSYDAFFNYIINIDILEEFAFLKTVDGGKINLDILPLAANQPRTVTRGIQKGATEDFKTTIEKQVQRCDEDVQSLIQTFLLKESGSILASLH